MKTVKGGGQILRDNSQEVAGHGEDLQAFRSVEHVIRKPRVSQLVVMEIHRPGSRDQGTSPRVKGQQFQEQRVNSHKRTLLLQFRFMAERVWVDPRQLIRRKISTDQRGRQGFRR